MYARCPKCDHAPLPDTQAGQAWPAACPACGVILAKVGTKPPVRRAPAVEIDTRPGWQQLLLGVPARVDGLRFWGRVVLWAVFTAWGLAIMGRDIRDPGLAGLAHGPLLVFHEAGHVVFAAFGDFMHVFGGTLGQWLMPLVMALALLWQRRDPFGAAIGLWFLGVSVMDASVYMYDALDPQLTLLGGHTGADGPHDWIWLFSEMGLLPRAQAIGVRVKFLGAALVMAALCWAAAVLWLQYPRIALHEMPEVLEEED